MTTSRLILILASLVYMVCHYTYLAGIPFLKELSSFALIGAMCFWFTDGLFRTDQNR